MDVATKTMRLSAIAALDAWYVFPCLTCWCSCKPLSPANMYPHCLHSNKPCAPFSSIRRLVRRDIEPTPPSFVDRALFAFLAESGSSPASFGTAVRVASDGSSTRTSAMSSESARGSMAWITASASRVASA